MYDPQRAMQQSPEALQRLHEILELAKRVSPMNDLKICNGIYPVLHVHHVWILKGSADVEDAIHSRYSGQKGVA